MNTTAAVAITGRLAHRYPRAGTTHTQWCVHEIGLTSKAQPAVTSRAAGSSPAR
ncbi:hypothetical protein [Amycolatopsis sp. EV170708-02-1]|uniref:hypothetical protein n=1 Tax=Amycolatopsis sp. EV170708-02-1 TaxID=2919322 RepID=UPI001F0C278C|nr:hypothetical protein [Amycolatopsis sp. EV170708-02-1]UMP06509.1 hypothetical protein MJQ72_17615 [Amycolatopsis sp. EV170708-02-1]